MLPQSCGCQLLPLMLTLVGAAPLSRLLIEYALPRVPPPNPWPKRTWHRALAWEWGPRTMSSNMLALHTCIAFMHIIHSVAWACCGAFPPFERLMVG
jgi:hypothetical protein